MVLLNYYSDLKRLGEEICGEKLRFLICTDFINHIIYSVSSISLCSHLGVFSFNWLHCLTVDIFGENDDTSKQWFLNLHH